MSPPGNDREPGSLLDLAWEYFRRRRQGLPSTEPSLRALDGLFAALYPIVYGVVAKHLRRVEDREDGTQAVMLVVLGWMQDCRFDDQEVDFVPWVRGIARHVGIKTAGTAEREQQTVESAGQLGPHPREDAFDPSTRLEATEERIAQAKLLERGLHELRQLVSARDFEIFLERRLKGRKARQVGKTYHLSPDRVRSIERRLLKALLGLMNRIRR